MKTCKKAKCQGEVRPPGISYCEPCRKERCERLQAYLRVTTEVRRERDRKNARKYRQSRTALAEAYRLRHAKTRAAASAVWSAQHPQRKVLIARLGFLVAKGEITKPVKCDDCKLVKSPIVAYGLEEVDGAPTVQAWTCWGCHWARKRGEA